jgi:ABC-2 type transport system ATP-binding protein
MSLSTRQNGHLMRSPAITARGPAKRYGDLAAVDDVDLPLEAGQIYALLGLNGAGMATLIRMLLGKPGDAI